MKTEILIPNLYDTSITIHKAVTAQSDGIYDWHIHKECEMFMLMEGERIFWVNKKEYLLKKGDIIFVNERMPHKTMTFSGSKGLLIQFDAKNETNIPYLYLSRLYQKEGFFKCGSEANNELTQCFNEIIAENTAQKLHYEKYIKAIIFKIIAILNRYGVLSEPVFNSAEIERLIPVLKYTEENFSENINLDDMARLLSIDKSHFCRIFKKITGLTFMEYLNYVRICNAKKLLVLSGKRISEIAAETGFSSASYFTETFKKYLSYPPGYYRKSKSEN